MEYARDVNVSCIMLMTRRSLFVHREIKIDLLILFKICLQTVLLANTTCHVDPNNVSMSEYIFAYCY